MKRIDKPVLAFRVPGRDEPGFLRRLRAASKYRQSLQRALDTGDDAAWNDVIGFLIEYVEEPRDRREARELLLDASENEILHLLDLITGRNGDEVPLATTTPASSIG